MKKFLERLTKYFREHKKSSIFSLIFIVVFYIFVFSTLDRISSAAVKEMTYSEFEQHLLAGDVDAVSYNNGSEYMSVILFNDKTKDMTEKERRAVKHSKSETYRVLYPGDKTEIPVKLDSDNKTVVPFTYNGDGELHYFAFRQGLMKYDIIPAIVQDETLLRSLFSMIIVICLYAGVFCILMRFMGAGMRGVSEKDIIQTSDVTFDEIIGHEEIIDDIQFITDLIKDPTKGDKIGAKLPKGILFTGPPGTGKTLLAKAIAHEAGVPFLYQNASGFIEMFVGLGAKRVRGLFKIARKHAPCIIFIDEIDAVGGSRDRGKGSSEDEQTVNALLQEMDGFSGRDGVFIIAATNRPESLDQALVRSGRFDRQITVNPPRDWKVRRDLFKHYLAKFTTDENIDVDGVSKQVSGFTGADIAMVCNEASIIAVMKHKDCIDIDCIEEAIDKKVLNGSRSKSESHEADRTIVAYHEAGHAVMTYLTGQSVTRASIQSMTSGVGGVVFSEDTDTAFQTAEDLKNSVLIAYAGRASEDIKFGSVTTGASNDITKATHVMVQYIEHLGFDGDFGLLDVGVLTKSHFVSSDAVTERLSAMSVSLYKECKDMLSNNYELVERVAKALLEKNVLTGSAIKKIIDSV